MVKRIVDECDDSVGSKGLEAKKKRLLILLNKMIDEEY